MNLFRSVALFALLGAVAAASAAVRYRFDYSLYGSFPSSVTVKTATFIVSDMDFGAGQVEHAHLDNADFLDLLFFPTDGATPADTVGVSYRLFGTRPATFFADFEDGAFQKYGTYTDTTGFATLTVSNVAGTVPSPAAALPFALMALRRRKRA